MKTICIHQPDFLPWLGFLHRLTQSDVFVLLDNVQFLKRGWHHRDKIKTVHGVQWLTVPVKNKGRYRQLLLETEIDNTVDWRREHLNTLHHAYSRAACFSLYYPVLEEIYRQDYRLLTDFNISLLNFLLQTFGIEIEILRASSLQSTGHSNELLIQIIREVGGQRYLTGTGAKEYLNESLFASAGIEVMWQNFNHPVYPQLFGNYEPYLSSIDYVLNCGGKIDWQKSTEVK